MDQIEIKIQVPKVVDQLWRALGYDETDYQYDFLESLNKAGFVFFFLYLIPLFCRTIMGE